MLELLGRTWWVPVVRGVIAVLFGLAALLWPDLTVTTMVIVFGIFAIADGVTDLIGIFTWSDNNDSRLLRGLSGVISIGAGLVALIWPSITALTLLYIIAIWAIVFGVIQVVAAIRLRRVIEGEFLLGLGGVLSILFGIVAILFPREGILSLTWLLGFFAILYGVSLIALGIEIRNWRQERGPRAMA